MTVQQGKQLVKNALYRTIGETSAALGLAANGETVLRVLMYHKINDIPDNPTTVPVGHFDDQLAQLGELGYRVVDLDAVLDHYVLGTPLPEKAVLITFDDGYRDIVENALPVLQKHGYPAVIFVPVAFMEDPMPLPHEMHLAERGVRNPTLDWGLVRELDAAGVRVESHGIAHRPLAEVALDEAVREIAVSKLKLEEQLGRPVRAYAYVKGSELHFHPVHESLLKQAGYDIAFTSISRANGSHEDPFRLGRYNVEPYAARTFELVLAGACDLIALKDTVAGTHARRLFNQALGTSTR
ncbi:MAG: polysaccharide deacetylase family protein [Actinobacteria bacterium]|nr:polysaccharide deacetylase family protein [Actinomycetota bacterium]MBV8598701.1 polysaccharide deacetylase family protein [Actinomycetota bacterium]